MLSDKQLMRVNELQQVIYPFATEQLKNPVSYGLSSYGYDIRIADEVKIFKPTDIEMVDPIAFDEKNLETLDVLNDGKYDYVILPPHSYALGYSVERFDIPRGLMTICLGKSTYARSGIIVNVTPFEPEWTGHATLELSNPTPLYVKIYVNSGIAQIIFLEGSQVCATSYADRKGKYQDQPAQIVTPR